MNSDAAHGRAALRGALVGFPIAVVLITCLGLAYGFEWKSALGMGLFVGIWGGLGFGAMMGATRSLAKEMF